MTDITQFPVGLTILQFVLQLAKLGKQLIGRNVLVVSITINLFKNRNNFLPAKYNHTNENTFLHCSVAL